MSCCCCCLRPIPFGEPSCAGGKDGRTIPGPPTAGSLPLAAMAAPLTPPIMFCLTPTPIICIGPPSSYPIRTPLGEPMGGGCGGRGRCPGFMAALTG